MAVKTKVRAKKQKTSKVNPPSGKGLTYEKVWAALMETKKQQEETARIVKENALQMKENDRFLTEKFKETDRVLNEKFDRTDRVLNEKFDKVDKIVGRLGNRFGEMVEHLVAPNIKEKFNELGFEFTRISSNNKIAEPGKKNELAEIDILLENGDIAIAVEIKARPVKEDVENHIERLEKLRIYADIKDDKRKFQGAVAGAIMNNEIRSYILENGLYLIEQTGDTIQINIPKGFKPREW